MTSKSTLHILKNVAGIAIIGATAYFVIKALNGNWDAFSQTALQFHPLIVLSVVLFAAAVISTGLFWGKLASQLSGHPIAKIEAIQVQIASWLLKYIPGQAGSLLGKVAWAHSKGLDKKAIAVSFIYEHLFVLLATLVITVPLLSTAFLSSEYSNYTLAIIVVIAVLLVIVFFCKGLLYKVLNWALKKVGKQPLSPSVQLSSMDIVSYTAGFIAPRVINGLAFVLVVMVSPFGIQADPWLLGATYILAGLVGILFIFAPSGIGAREAVIVLFLQPYYGADGAMILAIAARLYATIADLVLAAIYALIHIHFRTRKS